MSYNLSQEQEMLQAQVRDLVAKRATPDVLRRLITDRQPWDEALWREIADLGLLGAAIPEIYGGVGLGARELAVIMEDIGRGVAPIPFFSSICLAAEAIIIAGSETQKAKWLPKLATGEIVGTFAGDTTTASFLDGKVTGRSSPVPDATIADICVVVVVDGLVVVDLKGGGVTLCPLTGFDELRHHAAIDFVSVQAELLDGAPGQDGVAKLLDRAAIYQAFEQIGGAEAAMLMARDYSMQRYIFGRPLASYQITKHKLVELLIQIELARSIALNAANSIDSGDANLPSQAAAARLAATRAYENAARENLQVHGGIGFTWDADVHFHLRRARLLALDLGSVEIWTDRLIAGLAEAA